METPDQPDLLLGVLLGGEDGHPHVGGRGQHPGAVGGHSVEVRNHGAELDLEDSEGGGLGIRISKLQMEMRRMWMLKSQCLDTCMSQRNRAVVEGEMRPKLLVRDILLQLLCLKQQEFRSGPLQCSRKTFWCSCRVSETAVDSSSVYILP